MKTKKLKKALKKLDKVFEEILGEKNSVKCPIDEIIEELFEEQPKEQPLTDANGEELVVGRLYYYSKAKEYLYYCGYYKGSQDKIPVFELVDNRGCTGVHLPEGYKSIASDTYWSYIGLNKNVEIATLEEDEYYYVEEDSFWMIGKVSVGNNGDNRGTALRGDCYYAINPNNELRINDSWCYSDTSRTFRKATEEEIKWLERCNEEGKYISKKEALKEYKVGDWVIASIGDSTQYIGRFKSKQNHYYELDDWTYIPKGTKDVKETFRNGGAFDKIERLATYEEIKNNLVREANKKGFVRGFQLSNIKNHSYIGEIISLGWYYYHEFDELTNMEATIYENGVWSEIKEPYKFKVGDFVFKSHYDTKNIKPRVTPIVEIRNDGYILTKDYRTSSGLHKNQFYREYRLATDKEIREYCDFTNQP